MLFGRQRLGAPHVVVKVRVAAVDDRCRRPRADRPSAVDRSTRSGRRRAPSPRRRAARVSAATSASSDRGARARRSLRRVATASALRSKATTWWPPRVRRVTMLRPILPRPTKPSCIRSSYTNARRSLRAPGDASVGPYERDSVTASEGRPTAACISAGSGAGRCDVQRAPARRRRATRKSPSACASSSVPNENGSPGIGTSSRGVAVISSEDAGVRSALVQLTGRVQIPWTVAEHRRGAAWRSRTALPKRLQARVRAPRSGPR